MDNEQVKPNKFNIVDDDFIKQNYIFRDNNSITYIANKLNKKRIDIQKRITQLGITGVRRYKDCSLKTKEPCIELAYIMGCYLSDGWVHKDVFELHSLDKEYCEEVIRCLKVVIDGEFNETIRYYEMEQLNKNKKIKYRRGQYRIRVRSTDLCSYLISITNSKQTIPESYVIKNSEISKSLLCGLMDGDGFVSTSKKTLHRFSGYKLGLCGHSYIYGAVNKYPALFDSIGIRYKTTIQKNDSPGFLVYILDKKSFIDNNCYFKIQRKQDRIETIKKLYMVTSTSIMGNLI